MLSRINHLEPELIERYLSDNDCRTLNGRRKGHLRHAHARYRNYSWNMPYIADVNIRLEHGDVNQQHDFAKRCI